MTQLIAVIDGSAYSESVCDHAAWAARGGERSVAIVHVLGRRDVSSEPANLSGSIGLGARSELLAELAELDAQKARLALKRGRAILDGARARLEAAGVTDVDTRLRHGELLETVAEFEDDAEMIVIGKRGEAAAFAGDHLGSNLERVVRATHKKILVAERSFRSIKRALIAYDGGASADKAIADIATSSLFKDVACHLLAVGSDSTERQQRIGDAAARLRDAGIAVAHQVLPGQPETVLTEVIAQRNVDLLVMGAYGHSRIRNLIIGSTTTEMLRSSKISVLLFR